MHAACAKLVDFVQPRRTPTLREYLLLRPTDGGMVLAAMWCELAGRCVTPDWHDALVQSLLADWTRVSSRYLPGSAGSKSDPTQGERWPAISPS